jgi:hypothetical protein
MFECLRRQHLVQFCKGITQSSCRIVLSIFWTLRGFVSFY